MKCKRPIIHENLRHHSDVERVVMRVSDSMNFDPVQFKQDLLNNLTFRYGKTAASATTTDWYLALGTTLADYAMVGALSFEETVQQNSTRSLNYLSLEFLIGRLTRNNLMNVDWYDDIDSIFSSLGVSICDVLEEERDPALGNGGLGRLAACFMDSLASLRYPAIGYGLHYEYGLFRQGFEEGHQIEKPDDWCGDRGYPWQRLREDLTQDVGFYGQVKTHTDDAGRSIRQWIPALTVKGLAWDIPVIGYKNNCVLPLRLWECRAIEPFDFSRFNQGDYLGSQFSALDAGNLTKVLYPNDNHYQGKVLRLMQQYFHCACSIGDIVSRHLAQGHAVHSLAEWETIQLNDTHPTIAIPEVMRILLDDHQLKWAKAWSICTKLFAYTNHTLLPEALEMWSESLLTELLPRHMQIIFDINHHFLREIEVLWPHDVDMKRQLSIIEEGPHRMVRMANLCVVTAYAVNGVAALHSDLVKRDLFPEFDRVFPNKLTNVTNGVTPRRWLVSCNPQLSQLITESIGDGWQVNLQRLQQLADFAEDSVFQRRFADVKRANKLALVDWIQDNLQLSLSTDAIFDVQIKRLHEYKRQHLNLLHILSLYHRLLNDPDFDMQPRVFIFAAKAAPGYALAKDIIFAINKVAETVNHDPRLNDKLKVVFLPDYCVSLAELIIPAADVSEQISTAGKEASGTGNMKLALNGALTVGTLDGANVEICEEVGEENLFIFGASIDDIKVLDKEYNPFTYYEKNKELRTVLDLLLTDTFTDKPSPALMAIRHNLLDGGDPYRVLADFSGYLDVQTQVDKTYQTPHLWWKKAILNTARMGKFSSDRSIQDYVANIWKLTPLADV